MTELAVYFARAMDERSIEDVASDDEKYTKLLRSIGATIVNPFIPTNKRPIQDGWSIAQRDLADLEASDILLADLSISDYQYVGCLFEIVHATQKDIPVILVIGEREFDRRFFFQAYCDFIVRDAAEAVEYIRRVHTKDGIERQMAEMQKYYDRIASRYRDSSVRTHKRSLEDMKPFTGERAELRAVIKEYVKGKVCQIGIGTGDWTRTVCEVANAVIGVETSSEMLVQARNNLSAYNNISFLQCDALKEDISGGPFDCVVIYFLLSLLPRSVQDELFARIRRVMKPDSRLVIADTMKIGDLPATGLGRRQLQKRTSDGDEFILYKEHFVGDTLVKLLEKHNYKVIDSSERSNWFSWAVAWRVATEQSALFNG